MMEGLAQSEKRGREQSNLAAKAETSGEETGQVLKGTEGHDYSQEPKACDGKTDPVPAAATDQKSSTSAKLRCQRIGCDAFYSEQSNEEGACLYHPGMPIFHDGTKEWGCCKARSHDFSLFLQLPGCMKGRHTQEKPTAKPVSTSAVPLSHVSPQPSPAPSSRGHVGTTPRADCQRCLQGLYCTALHNDMQTAEARGSAGVLSPSPQSAALSAIKRTQKADATKAQKPPKWDLSAERTCCHGGCGVKYREKDNSEMACHYHPGPAMFHDRKRGWRCCNVFVNDFDEFLAVPPCTKGWHDDAAD